MAPSVCPITFPAFHISRLWLILFGIPVFQFFGHFSSLLERPSVLSPHFYSLQRCPEAVLSFQSTYSLSTPFECQLSDNRFLVCLL